MYKLTASIIKEFHLLRRDLGGLIVLFIMPLVLIITITLIQNNTFKNIVDKKLPILILDLDQGDVSNKIKQQLNESEAFEIIETYKSKKIDAKKLEELVFKGKYQIGVIIPKNLTKDLNEKVQINVNKIAVEMGFGEDTLKSKTTPVEKEIKLFFDPATQIAFKNGIKNSIDKMVAEIENKTIYTTFEDQFSTDENDFFNQKQFITFTEHLPKKNNQDVMPNAVQHNVPAWSLFAIFFIIVPLSINLVKEKSQGTFIRQLTMPVPYFTFLLSKTIVYLIINYLQFLLMLVVGIYLFPYLSLDSLSLNGNFGLLSLVVLFSGLSAISIGLLIGTIAKTQEQSAPFGATLVVILAAVGGVWVPVFIMPKFMQFISAISPMNWGLNAFYDLLLRDGSLSDISFELLKLFLFFIIITTFAIFYEKKNRRL
jgi:ABC-2 type transport system permease protein